MEDPENGLAKENRELKAQLEQMRSIADQPVETPLLAVWPESDASLMAGQAVRL